MSIEAMKTALTDEEAIRYAQECSKSAYQRGYLDGIHRECPHCADYKAMYLRARDELRRLHAANDELLEFAKAVVRYAGNSCDDYLSDKARAAIAKATGENT